MPDETRFHKRNEILPTYQAPVPVPDTSPLDEPLVCITVNDDWMPYILGALHVMTDADVWEGNQAEKLEGTAKAFTLLDQIMSEDCPEGIPDDGCSNFLPENPFLQYFPNSPFTSPNYTPPGYASPPWYTNPLVPLPGVLPTDAMVNLLAVTGVIPPTGLLLSGLPRMRINFTGAGQLEIEMVKVLNGGFVLIQVDDDVTQCEFVDLTALSVLDMAAVLDLFDYILDGSFGETDVIELQIEGVGEHHVDVTFFPRIDAETIIGFGGGIRRVAFCADELMGTAGGMAVTGLRQNLMSCKWEIEYENNGVWVELGDIFVPECMPAALDQTLIRANPSGCGLMQLSLDAGASWSDIPGTNYYRNDALCSADNFYGRSDTARVHLHNAANTEQMRVGFKAGDNTRAEIVTVGRDLEINWGASTQKMFFGASDQTVHIDNTFPDAAGVKSMFRVGSRADNYHVIKANGRAGSSVPLIVAFAQNSGAGAGDMYAGNYAGEGYNFRVKSKGELQYRSELTVVHKPASVGPQVVMQEVSSFDAGGTSPLIPRSVTNLYDNGVPRTVIDKRAAAGKAEIAFLGQVPSPRVALSGDCMGNPVTKAIAQVLHTFGLVNDTSTLGVVPEPPPGAGLCELDHCGYVESTVKLLSIRLYKSAAFIAGTSLSGLNIDQRYDEILSTLNYQFGSVAKLYEWITIMFSEFSTNADDIALNDRIARNLAFALDTLSELLFCFTDDCGRMSDLQWYTMLNLLPNSELEDVEFHTFIEALDQEGYDQVRSFAVNSKYALDLEMDCGAFACDYWTVLMNFHGDDWSSSVTLVAGNYTYLLGYWEEVGGVVTIEINADIRGVLVNFNTDDIGSQVQEIIVTNIDTSVAVSYFPSLGINSITWAGDAPDGVRVALVAPTVGQGWIESCTVIGVGTEPVP